MLIDVLDIVIPSLDFRTTKGLQDPVKGGYKWTVLTDPDAFGVRHLYYLKTTKGGTFDLLAVPPDNLQNGAKICERATELKWDDPTSGKVNFLYGQPRLPRYLDVPDNTTNVTGSTVIAASNTGPYAPTGMTQSTTTTTGAPYFWQWLVTRPVTDYVIIPPGTITPNYKIGDTVKATTVDPNYAAVPVITSDGGVRCTFSGPYAYPGKGDIPAGEYWMNEYERNLQSDGTYKAMERNIYVKGYGWVEWYPFVWDTTNKTWMQDPNSTPSVFTKIVATPPPALPVRGYA